jgi:hypothetical protein
MLQKRNAKINCEIAHVNEPKGLLNGTLVAKLRIDGADTGLLNISLT